MLAQLFENIGWAKQNICGPDSVAAASTVSALYLCAVVIILLNPMVSMWILLRGYQWPHVGLR